VAIVGSESLDRPAARLVPSADPEVVLVIDLSADGGGERIATVFHRPPRRHSAYWRPLAAAP